MPDSKEILIPTQPEAAVTRPQEIVDVRKTEIPVPPQVESWIRKVEKVQSTSVQQINDDGQVSPVSNTAPPPSNSYQTKTTKTVFLSGFGKAVSEAGHWLSVFLLKMIKLHEGNVKFDDE